MDRSKPRNDDRVPPAKTPSTEGSVKHVVRTGLPPGVEIEDVTDPGNHSPKGPADDRS